MSVLKMIHLCAADLINLLCGECEDRIRRICQLLQMLQMLPSSLIVLTSRGIFSCTTTSLFSEKPTTFHLKHLSSGKKTCHADSFEILKQGFPMNKLKVTHALSSSYYFCKMVFYMEFHQVFPLLFVQLLSAAK